MLWSVALLDTKNHTARGKRVKNHVRNEEIPSSNLYIEYDIMLHSISLSVQDCGCVSDTPRDLSGQLGSRLGAPFPGQPGNFDNFTQYFCKKHGFI